MALSKGVDFWIALVENRNTCVCANSHCSLGVEVYLKRPRRNRFFLDSQTMIFQLNERSQRKKNGRPFIVGRIRLKIGLVLD